MKLYNKKILSKKGLQNKDERIDAILFEQMPVEFEHGSFIQYFGENCYHVAVDNDDIHAIYSNPEVFSCFLMDLMHQMLEPYINIVIANDTDQENDYLETFDEYQSSTAKTINKKPHKQLLVSKGLKKDLLSGVLVREYPLARMRKSLIIYSYEDNIQDIFDKSFDEFHEMIKQRSFAVKTFSGGDGVLDSMLFCLNPTMVTFDQFLMLVKKFAKEYNLKLEVKR